MKEFKLSEVIREYPEISLLSIVGGGKVTDGETELLVSDYRKVHGSAPVLACEVRDKKGNQVARFNVKP